MISPVETAVLGSFLSREIDMGERLKSLFIQLLFGAENRMKMK